MPVFAALSRLVVSRIGLLFASGDERDTEIFALRHELLDWTTIWNERQLRRLLAEYIEHYNTHRPHRGIGQRAPDDNAFSDHLEVEVRGAPNLNVVLHEIELRNRSAENTGVGRAT